MLLTATGEANQARLASLRPLIFGPGEPLLPIGIGGLGKKLKDFLKKIVIVLNCLGWCGNGADPMDSGKPDLHM
jgi:hypothetical protein